MKAFNGLQLYLRKLRDEETRRRRRAGLLVSRTRRCLVGSLSGWDYCDKLTPSVKDINVHVSCSIIMVFEIVSELEKLVDDVADEGHRP